MERKKINKIIHFYEPFSKKKKNIIFEEKLKLIEKIISKKNIKHYSLNNYHWKKNNVQPTKEFHDFISNLILFKNYILNPPPEFVVDVLTLYLKLNSRQLRIIDSLFIDGSSEKKYIYINKNNIEHLYSEHSGSLYISDGNLESIIISPKTNRVIEKDPEIFLPTLNNYKNYQYIFHTHPETPSIGSRISVGVLYEIPSYADIINFAENSEYGITIGSIVVAPEGIYLIKSRCFGKNINKNITQEDKERIFFLQNKYINKHKKIIEKKDIDLFHKIIFKDFKFIEECNDVYKKYNIKIDYFPRVKDKELWILDDLVLPLYTFK